MPGAVRRKSGKEKSLIEKLCAPLCNCPLQERIACANIYIFLPQVVWSKS